MEITDPDFDSRAVAIFRHDAIDAAGGLTLLARQEIKNARKHGLSPQQRQWHRDLAAHYQAAADRVQKAADAL